MCAGLYVSMSQESNWREGGGGGFKAYTHKKTTPATNYTRMDQISDYIGYLMLHLKKKKKQSQISFKSSKAKLNCQ